MKRIVLKPCFKCGAKPVWDKEANMVYCQCCKDRGILFRVYGLKPEKDAREIWNAANTSKRKIRAVSEDFEEAPMRELWKALEDQGITEEKGLDFLFD